MISKKKKNNNLFWIIGTILLLLIVGLIIYLVWPKKNGNDNKNYQYLPSVEESENEINQRITSKNLDKLQANVDFLAKYIPYINLWEVSSLSELDKSIELINKKSGFSSFKIIPEQKKFDKEFVKNFTYKMITFQTTCISRKSDNTIDWKNYNNFNDYKVNVLQPLINNAKFKSNFATQNILQELEGKITQEINPSLVYFSERFNNLY